MATDTAPARLRDDFVTRRLLLLTAAIFLLNAPSLTAWGTPTAQFGAAVLYLGVALVIASLGKGARHRLPERALGTDRVGGGTRV